MRDDAARESFKSEIGRVGVTLYVRSPLLSPVLIRNVRTLFNSKGLEYDDVSQSFCANCPSCVRETECLKVILYNFFEESAPEKFWQFVVDANQNQLLDSRYAPLIHEVSDSVRI